MSQINVYKNKGTGAGGANTNAHGKRFELTTNNEPNLLKDGFVQVNPEGKKYYYLHKDSVVFITQGYLRKYIHEKYDISLSV
jgi:hypothetical protein